MTKRSYHLEVYLDDDKYCDGCPALTPDHTKQIKYCNAMLNKKFNKIRDFGADYPPRPNDCPLKQKKICSYPDCQL